MKSPVNLVAVGLAAALLVAGCGTPGPTGAPPATPSPTPTPTPTATPRPSAPAAPPGTAFVEVPEAGIRLPVPVGWESVDAAGLGDAATREALAAKFPGSAKLIGSLDRLGGRAEPVFLAADPSPASLASALAPSLSVLVSQPSVGGFLLELVAGFIGDGMTEVLGATEPPVRDKVQLPAGETVRFRYAIPAADGEEIVAVAWVIGAPGGTLLVTIMGTASVLGDLDLDALAAAITPAGEDAP